MKKIIALALAIVMLLPAAGCGVKASAYDSYSSAFEKMESYTAVEANTQTVVTMTIDGEVMEVAVEALIKEYIHSETDVEFSADATTSMLGMSIDMNMYYKDGYYYMSVMGQNMKMSLPLEDAMKQASTEAIEFEESAIKEQAVTDKDGGKELTFVLDGAAMTTMLNEQLGAMEGTLGVSALEYNYGDVNVTVFVDSDGNLKTTDMTTSYEMEVEGDKVPADITMHMEYIAFNEDVSVDVPEDLDSYVEVNASDVGL